jgi:hypothetical protein
MEADQIIYEQGMTVRRETDHWSLQNLDGGAGVAIDDPFILAARYGLRPVVIGGMNGNSYAELLLAPGASLTYFFVGTNQIQAALLKDAEGFEQGLAVVYLLNALEHHCLTLAKRYSANCASYSRFPSMTEERSDFAHFGGDRSIYCEFDALITCVRRTYDALRYLLWRHFGERTTCPSAFYKAYPKCTRLPQSLRMRLHESWETFGKNVTEYRDCLQHYVPVNRPQSTQFMHRLDEGQWTGRALIPDNPEVRSYRLFKFTRMTDALSYGWDASHELQDISIAICDHIAQS